MQDLLLECWNAQVHSGAGHVVQRLCDIALRWQLLKEVLPGVSFIAPSLHDAARCAGFLLVTLPIGGPGQQRYLRDPSLKLAIFCG